MQIFSWVWNGVSGGMSVLSCDGLSGDDTEAAATVTLWEAPRRIDPGPWNDVRFISPCRNYFLGNERKAGMRDVYFVLCETVTPRVGETERFRALVCFAYGSSRLWHADSSVRHKITKLR
jgi:hypothetical protein